jgi:DNA invertase Pin-like site-specific DNA recombinase
MDRPGLKQLMRDIVARKVRIVVVYKVDRLTRSLADFAKLVEVFDTHGVSFVSVTQQFNTTSSMGRLTLNVLLSFAQFEREVTGERIRDKIAASKARGMWMGGMPPVGYEVRDKALVIDEDSASLIRGIYRRYLELGSVRLLKADLDRRGLVTPPRVSKRQGQSGGRSFSRGHLYRILSNPVYAGKVAHRDKTYSGQHPAIIDDELWGEVQTLLASNLQGQKSKISATEPGLLAGLVFDDEGERLTSVHSRKKTKADITAAGKSLNQDTLLIAGNTKTSRRYRYYVSQRLIKESKEQAPDALRIPAQELEQVVIGRIAHFLEREVELFGVLEQHGLNDAAAVNAVLRVAAETGGVLQGESLPDDTPSSGLTSRISVIHVLQGIVERIVVRPDEIVFDLKLGELMERARSVSHASAAAWEGYDWVSLTHQIRLPVQIRKSGLVVKLIIRPPGHEIKREADIRMVKLLAKGHVWFGLLASGKAQSIQEIGDQAEVSRCYVSKVIQMRFLAPDIVRAILSGKQPPMLTADKLMRSVPPPVDWQEQRRLLGFV